MAACEKPDDAGTCSRRAGRAGASSNGPGTAGFQDRKISGPQDRARIVRFRALPARLRPLRWRRAGRVAVARKHLAEREGAPPRFESAAGVAHDVELCRLAIIAFVE